MLYAVVGRGDVIGGQDWMHSARDARSALRFRQRSHGTFSHCLYVLKAVHIYSCSPMRRRRASCW
jgi:hypothetical protein